MKKLLLLTALASVFFFSCKKDHSHSVQPAQKMYKVTFDIASGFTQTINSSQSRKQQVNSLHTNALTNDLASYTKDIRMMIFDSKGNVVRQFQQTAANVSNYGVIVDSLTSGTYSVMVAAGQSGLQLNYNNPVEDLFAVFYNQDGIHPYGPFGDTFFSQFQLTVATGPVNKSVTLIRIVGKLEVDFSDAIPQNAAKVNMKLDKENLQYIISTGHSVVPDTVSYNYTVPDSVKGTHNYKISTIVLNTTTPFVVSLTAYDNANNVIASHIVNNVSCTINQRTILTGNLSNPPNNPGFGVTVDPNWQSPVVVHY